MCLQPGRALLLAFYLTACCSVKYFDTACMYNPPQGCDAHQRGACTLCFGCRGSTSRGMATCMLVECSQMPWFQSRAQPPCVQSSARRCFCSAIQLHNPASGVYLPSGRSCMTGTAGWEIRYSMKKGDDGLEHLVRSIWPEIAGQCPLKHSSRAASTASSDSARLLLHLCRCRKCRAVKLCRCQCSC